ncbi:MAG: glycerol-3-phosphate dehydrogenase (NAD(P)+) [Planctomycetota bacterium]|jgi:glycerol-3-phosphate dehydrogenase (NAD(P)+)
MTNNNVGKVLVLGDGSWGTTLALTLCRNGVDTTLWSAFAEQSDKMCTDRENAQFLPGVELPAEMNFSADPHSASKDVDLVISVVPTQYLRSVAVRFEDALHGNTPVISATKGLEIETFSSPTTILKDVLGNRPIGVLTGPSHAEEVARGLPASVVIASEDQSLAELGQRAFSSESFRIYTSADPIGAELAGALKNVIALAAGISDGLELGDNAKSALLTRGMVEMARFGVQRGGKSSTFFGLAGFGDLVTTCCSQHSRNRAVGEAIGKGETLEQILERMSMVAEGVWTTKALYGPESDLRGLELPIAEQVHSILFEKKDPREAVLDLMRRDLVGEMDGVSKVKK